MIISIIGIILLVIFSIILLSIINRQNDKILKLQNQKERGYEEYYNNLIKCEKNKIDEELAAYHLDKAREYHSLLEQKEQERKQIEKSLIERKQAVEEIIEQLENRRREAEKAYQETIKQEKEKIDIDLNCYHQLKLGDIDIQLAKIQEEKVAAAKKVFDEQTAELENQKREKAIELAILLEEIDDFKKKQTVINEEILRRRELEEKQEFFKISLDENSIRDIQILLSIREKLISRENLDKLIYDVYISKPVMEMVKRVLAGGAPSGIYKITRLKTGEIYIGKSTDVKKRWTEHCKTVFGVGSIAHSILHTTMKKDGIENFTFELLEEVSKDKLTEREKYWITFYDSKNYGLNERNG